MHGFYLTAVTLLLVAAVVAYVILADFDESPKLRVVFSWLIVVLALLLLIGVNVTCAYERTEVRIIYIVLFLLLVYNALTDQFMDESLLNMSVSLKAKVVGGIVVGMIAYVVARTRVWMTCNMHIDALHAVYRNAITPHYAPSEHQPPSLVEPSLVEPSLEQPSLEHHSLEQPSFVQPPPQFLEVIEVQRSRPMLSREEKVDLMEEIIDAAGFKPRQVSRMLRQKSKQSKRSKRSKSKL
jgi:hypothetical protein